MRSWLFIFVLAMVLPGSAHAWVQTTTCLDEPAVAPTSTPFCTGNQSPKPFAWPKWTVPYRIDARGSAQFGGNNGLSDELRQTLRDAIEVWNQPECSTFRFEYDGETEIDAHDADDRLNVVLFQSEEWPYSGASVAITSVTARLDGTIIDADLEINEVDNEFGLVETDGAGVWDLKNAVTHEAGHMLGLDHSNVDGATMEFDTRPGETSKRDLAADDIEGLCTIYEAGEEPIEEPPPPPPDDPGCCAVAPGGSARSLPVGLLLLVAGMTSVRHRRWRRRQRE